MKLEAVDKRNPILIRVATVTDVVYRQLRVRSKNQKSLSVTNEKWYLFYFD